MSVPVIIAAAAAVYTIVCMMAAARIAYGNGRSPTIGAAWGLLLGVVGVLIVATIGESERRYE